MPDPDTSSPEDLDAALRVQQVFVLHARDHLGHARGAAGQLEHRHLKGVALECADGHACSRRILRGQQVFKTQHSVTRLAA